MGYFPPALQAQDSDIRIIKRQWGAFYGTELEMQLRRSGIQAIVLGGISTNIGVESTARNAWELGFELVLVEDICSAHDIAKRLNFDYNIDMSYLIDFRRKVLSVREKKGLSIRETAKRFHIGSASVSRWLNQIDPKPALLNKSNF